MVGRERSTGELPRTDMFQSLFFWLHSCRNNPIFDASDLQPLTSLAFDSS